MGLKYFYSFLKEHGWETSIRIEDRVSDFKKKHPDEKPIIVFDFNQMISFLVGTTRNCDVNTELFCGGRERNIINAAEDWFKKLTSLDCKLVFWCEGPLESDKFELYKRNSLQKCKTIRNMFLKDTFLSISLKAVVRIVPIYYDGLIELAKMYGEVYFSLENENDKDIAHYATKNNALAVVSQDTDMIFFDGSWEIWASYRINSPFDSTMFQKRRMQKYLKLNNIQLSLFAALYQTLTEGKNYSWSVSVAQFRLIASFLSKNIKEAKYCNILSDSVINSMILCLENNKLGKIRKGDLIKAIDFYNLEHMNAANYQQFAWLENHTMECGTALYEILNKIDINMTLLFAQGFGLPTHLKNMKLRQVGLVRYSEWTKTNKKFHTTFHIFCNDYESFTKEPIYPSAPVPTISTILGYENQKLSIDQKLQIVIWVIFGENACSQWAIGFVKDLKNIIETSFFVPKLVLTFLVKDNIFTKNEANILATSLKISEKNRHRKYTNCPTILHRRCIQLGYMYTYTIYSVSTSLKICGLSKYFKSGHYDGFILHNIYNKFYKNPENLKQLGNYSDITF